MSYVPGSGKEYDFYLVCSFEFTCDGKRSLEPQEMIEFCVLKYCVKSRSVVEKFYSYVKPQDPINDKLSTFCKMLTCISDRKLAGAPSLQQILLDFDKWLWKQKLHQSRFVFVPHTHFDLQHMLPLQCKTMGYHCPYYFFSWLHLEEMHKLYLKQQPATTKPAVKQIRRRTSTTLLQSYAVRQEGRAHSASDNCNNTVSLIRNMTEKGVDFTQRVWETHISRKKDNSESDDGDSVLDPNEFEDLKEEETMAMFGRAASRCASGRTTPLERSGRSTPVGPVRMFSNPGPGRRTSNALRWEGAMAKLRTLEGRS